MYIAFKFLFHSENFEPYKNKTIFINKMHTNVSIIITIFMKLSFIGKKIKFVIKVCLMIQFDDLF